MPITVAPNGAMPIGTIVAIAGSTTPETWIQANGLEANIADYPELASICGTQFSPPPSSPTKFRLPAVGNQFYVKAL